MISSKRSAFRMGFLAVAALAWFVAGCSESPTPLDSSAQVSILQRPARAKITEGEELAIEDSAQVSPTQPSLLTVGDPEIGNSSIDVPSDAVENTTTINFVKMKVQRIGAVSAELRPHGMRFKRPVMVVLSYKGADLTGIDETKLAIFYWNPETLRWELVPNSVVDVQKKTVSAPLWHFSQYAIGGNG